MLIWFTVCPEYKVPKYAYKELCVKQLNCKDLCKDRNIYKGKSFTITENGIHDKQIGYPMQHGTLSDQGQYEPALSHHQN